MPCSAPDHSLGLRLRQIYVSLRTKRFLSLVQTPPMVSNSLKTQPRSLSGILSLKRSSNRTQMVNSTRSLNDLSTWISTNVYSAKREKKLKKRSMRRSLKKPEEAGYQNQILYRFTNQVPSDYSTPKTMRFMCPGPISKNPSPSPRNSRNHPEPNSLRNRRRSRHQLEYPPVSHRSTPPPSQP